MHPLFRRRRPWLWLTAACLVMLAVAGVVFFLAEAPDGSEEAFELIQFGMPRDQADDILSRAYLSNDVNSRNPASVASSNCSDWPRLRYYYFSNHTVFLSFDENDRLRLKALSKRPRPWDETTLWKKVSGFVGLVREASGV
jgi:hypothetical protein